MALHDIVLAVRQLAGLAQDLFRDADLADVVEEAGGVDGADLLVVEAHAHGEACRVAGHILAVVEGVVVLGVDGRRQGGDHGEGAAVLLPLLLDAAHDELRPLRQALGRGGGLPEEGDAVLAALLGVVGGQVRVVPELLGTGGGVGRRADAHAEAQRLAALALRRPVDGPDPAADLLRQGLGPAGVHMGQEDAEDLAAGAEDGAALPHAEGDLLADPAEGSVPGLHAVELVVELEVVHVREDQGEAVVPAGLEELRLLLHEVAVVVDAGEGIDAGLPEHLLVEAGVLQGDGRDGADGLKVRDLVVVEALALLPGGQKEKADDLFPVLHGHDAVDGQAPEELLLRLPGGEVEGAGLELAGDEVILLLPEVGDLGAGLGDGEVGELQGAGAVLRDVLAALPLADVDPFHADLRRDGGRELGHDLHGAEGLGDLGGEALELAVLLLLPGEHGVHQLPEEGIGQDQDPGEGQGRQDGGRGVREVELLQGEAPEGGDEVRGHHDADESQRHRQDAPGDQEGHAEHPPLVEGGHQKGREDDAGQRVIGEGVAGDGDLHQVAGEHHKAAPDDDHEARGVDALLADQL